MVRNNNRRNSGLATAKRKNRQNYGRPLYFVKPSTIPIDNSFITHNSVMDVVAKILNSRRKSFG